MPIIKSAIKKMKVDAKRSKVNRVIKTLALSKIKSFRRTPRAKGLSGLFSAIDRAAKKKVFHKGRADRLKSRLSRLVTSGK